MARAVVFAYHNVGVRCLKVLLAQGIEVQLLVTHKDSPGEAIWFDSVEQLARKHALPVIAPEDPNTAALLAQIQALAPDFLFSFYYRRMLRLPLLAVPRLGAYNMHGSLLPKYRGRAPVNWAVIQGETETGATLHQMVEKPDTGGVVGQMAVPIGPDDTAFDVFNKVAEAAGQVLELALPGLITGTVPVIAQNLAKGSYFGGRKPEDGRIDWLKSARAIHNLVRGVAPPYPGAFTELDGKRLRVLRSRLGPDSGSGPPGPFFYAENGYCIATCSDRSSLVLLEMELGGKPFTTGDFLALYGNRSMPLPAQ